MPFGLPTYPLVANVWRGPPTVPAIGVPDVSTPANLCPGKRRPYSTTVGTLDTWLLVPALTDLRSTICATTPDLVEAPASSGRYYTVSFVDDVHKGSSSEFRFAVLKQLGPWPPEGGFAVGLSDLRFSRGQIFDWSIEVFPNPSVMNVALFDPSIPIAVGTTPVSQVRWYYIAIVWDTVTLFLYVDGVLDGSIPATGPLRAPVLPDLWATTDASVIGSGDWSELRFYQAALSLSEMIADGRGSVQAGIVAQYHCDDGSGVTVTDSVGGFDATLFGGVVWLPSGPGGGAIRFDLSNTQFATAPTALDNTSPFTFTLWYRPLPI